MKIDKGSNSKGNDLNVTKESTKFKSVTVKV